MITETRISLDSSAILRGSLQPKRSSNQCAYKYQMDLHNIAKAILDDVFSGKLVAYVASPVLVEVAVVSARLTGDATFGKNLSAKLQRGCIVLDDTIWLAPAIDIGVAVRKCGGFDCVIYTCAVITRTLLVTNDQGLNEICKRQGHKTYFLREKV